MNSEITFTLPRQAVPANSFIILKSKDFLTDGIYNCDYKYELGIDEQAVGLYSGNHPVTITDRTFTVIDVYGPQPIISQRCLFSINCNYNFGWARRKSFKKISTEFGFNSTDWIIQRLAFLKGMPFACQSFQPYGKSKKSTGTTKIVST